MSSKNSIKEENQIDAENVDNNDVKESKIEENSVNESNEKTNTSEETLKEITSDKVDVNTNIENEPKDEIDPIEKSDKQEELVENLTNVDNNRENIANENIEIENKKKIDIEVDVDVDIDPYKQVLDLEDKKDVKKNDSVSSDQVLNAEKDLINELQDSETDKNIVENDDNVINEIDQEKSELIEKLNEIDKTMENDEEILKNGQNKQDDIQDNISSYREQLTIEVESENDKDVVFETHEKEKQSQYDRTEVRQRRENLFVTYKKIQGKLCEYFLRKKSEEVKRLNDTTDANYQTKYYKTIEMIDDINNMIVTTNDKYSMVTDEWQEKYNVKVIKANNVHTEILETIKSVALSTIDDKFGKNVTLKTFEKPFDNWKVKQQQKYVLTLANIKLKNKLQSFANTLKSKEELTDGLHLIDFEQLKIENQTYNEKIEERHVELLKLRKKITDTVQIISHTKERLNFTNIKNSLNREEFLELEKCLFIKRDDITKLKQERDYLRIENQNLMENSGLLGKTSLLKDYENRYDEKENLENELELLKKEHERLLFEFECLKKKSNCEKSKNDVITKADGVSANTPNNSHYTLL
ncbi:hypothetical protein A3Q56_03213 [Intoshia linei]|uniref:CCDC113/CCDC96 coiled-coil domain-containing protein n=1 Tax=Intoshia linei TaxID=1819745 RepID=A0A177B602_9BILA|nr:hypothetical protein A3Q56_03213 [Intoshia linei]